MKVFIRHTKSAAKSLMQWQKRYGGKRSVISLRFGVLVVTVIVLAIFPLFAPRSLAASIGPNNPTATNNAWTSSASIYASDGVYASTSIAASGTSSALNATGFGFNIPVGSTINGVQVDIQRYSPSNSKAAIQDSNVQLLKAGAATGTNQGATSTTWPTAEAYASYGSASSLWGATLTPSDVNATGFGVTITAKNVRSGGGATNTAYIDHIRVKVTYTPPPVNYNQASYRLFNNVDARVGGNTFVKAWGGAKNDYGQSIVQTTDGGYATTGYTDNGSYDMFLTKYDSLGSVSWTQTWGTSVGDYGYSLIQTTDGGYAVTGKTTSYGDGSSYDMYLAKYDSDGNLSWTRTWGGTGGDCGYSLIQTTDGGYAITGETGSYGAGSSDMFLARYDSSGALLWTRTWGGTGSESGNSLIQTTDGGYAITGEATSYSSQANYNDMILVRYDSTGTLLWNRTWDNPTWDDTGSSLVQTADGGYMITGTTWTGDSSVSGVVLAKYDGAGNLSWSRKWAGISKDNGNALIQTSDGGYAITGSVRSYGAGGGDMFLIKYDSAGNLSWSRTWGGTAFDSGYSLIQTTDGGYAVTGETDSYGAGGSDILLARFDSTGSISGCSSSMCQSPSATSSSLTASTSSPAATTTSPTAGITAPSASTSSLSLTQTNMVNNTAPIDVGSPLAAQSTAAVTPGDGQPFRVRMDIGISNFDLAANGQAFKLQYAPMTTSCSGASSYSDVTDTSTIGFYDNPAATSAGLLAANANDPTDGTNTTANGGAILESYQEKGTTTFTNPTAIPAGKDGMWDFALTTSGAVGGQHYCLRIAKDDGTTLNTYTSIPEVIAPPASYSQASYRLFANQDGSSSPGGALSFAAKVDYPINMYAAAAISADFNKDGKQDLAIASGSSNNVSILLNNGSGGFNAKVDYPTSTDTDSLVAVDLNGDSNLDIVATNYSTGTISVLLGTGTGSFGTKTDFATGTNPKYIVANDFNGDGKPDLAVATNTNSTVSVLLGTGTGSFGTKTDFPAGGGATDVAAVDLDGDGKLDLVTANNTANTVSVLLGTGTGSFGTKTDYPAGNGPSNTTIADFNGDGNPDLAMANVNGGNVSILPGNGTGGFGTKTDFATNSMPEPTGVGDFNSDGKPDLAAPDYINNTVSVLTNTTTFPASIDVGLPLADRNTAAAMASYGTPFRLRLDIGVSVSGVALSGQSFKLQYAPRAGTCNATSSAAYADVTGSSPLRYYDNPIATNGTSFAANANDPTDGTNTLLRQTYQEAGTASFMNSQSAIAANQDGMWDFALSSAASANNTAYCLRLVKVDGTQLTNYAQIPEVTIGTPVAGLTLDQQLRGGQGVVNGTKSPMTF